jgi:FkbM family methyltransferase
MLSGRILARMARGERLGTLRDTAAVLREPLRLGARRLRGGPTIGRYHLRGSGLAVHLRHDVLEDLATLIQTFRQDHYLPPPDVRLALEQGGRRPHAMDLGANIGMFGAWFLSRYREGRVTAYEADPANARVHAMTVRANASRVAWEVIAAAAATQDGEVRFVTGRATNSRLAAEGEGDAEIVAQHDVLERAGDVDLLKVDIEGGEWALLADRRLGDLPIRAIALEYHSERCPEADPRSVARQRLAAAGFQVADHELDATPGHGMVWGWRTA